jgi:hypothetical protein
MRVILWRFYFEGSRAVSKAELQQVEPDSQLVETVSML